MHTYTAVLDLHWFVVAYIGERVGSCCLVPSRNAMGPFPVVRFLLKEAHPCYVCAAAPKSALSAPPDFGQNRSRQPAHLLQMAKLLEKWLASSFFVSWLWLWARAQPGVFAPAS